MTYRRHIKRLMDILVAAFLLVLLSPLLLAIALCVKAFDPGPILFVQTRVGRNGEVFPFYKFRSMPVGTGDIPSDQLVSVTLTWVGAFLRRSNADELPQLFNILVGHMSLVGPRPSLPSQTVLMELRRANGALFCRPGLTGLAQVSSYDGMPVEVKAAFDGQYASRVRFMDDVRIVLRTFAYLLKPPPKY